jgi:hypothetical protein
MRVHEKPQTHQLSKTEFYRVLDHLPSWWRPIFVRVIYVAEDFWHWIMAAVPLPITQAYLRDLWNGAVERAGLTKVSVTQVQRLRSRLLAGAKERPVIRLLDDEVREDALLLTQLFPALALTEDEGRRLLLRVVQGSRKTA